MLLDVLKRMDEDKVAGMSNRKQRLEASTPLKHFLRPLIEESMARQMAVMNNTQPPQLPMNVGGMIEPPSINPLQNALMSSPQGAMPNVQQGGSPHATGYNRNITSS